MKRARLASLPAGPKQEPIDLTDRLLDRGAHTASDQPGAAPDPPAAAQPQRRRKATAAQSQPRRQAPHLETREPETAQQETPQRGVSTEEGGAMTVEQALRQAEAAAQALRQAARSTPARFQVAQGYRLDALAHHIRQVAEYIASLAKP